MNHQELSPIIFLERAKKVFPNDVAIITKDKVFSYLEFYELATKLALFIKNSGAKYGDKVAIIAPNSFILLLAHYAIPLAGCILVPINHKLKANTITHILKNSNSKILISRQDYLYNEITNIVELIIVDDFEQEIVIETKYKTIKNIFSENQNFQNTVEFSILSEHDTISINYTSGTTSLAKGVECTHRGTYLNALGECIEVGLSKKSNYLWVLPMTHCNGWCFAWAVSAVGATHVCVLEDYNPEKIILAIIKYQISHLCAAPTLLKFLTCSPEFNKLKNVDLTIITAGSFPEQIVIKKFLEYNINIIPVYGLTETYGPISIVHEKEEWREMDLDSRAAKLASQGLASVHGFEIKVIDEFGNDVINDGKTSGEIVVKSNSLMKGYYNDIEATKKAFQKGWFHTGDIAVVRTDGHMQIVDRKKDIIISGGEKISSIEVETVLMKHPDVDFAAVIPLRDEIWGEVPQAIIQRRSNKISEEELIQFCKNHLESYKCPKKIVFRDIPISANGKILKHELLERT